MKCPKKFSNIVLARITVRNNGIKARTNYLLQSIPDDHVADFHYMDDARDIWNAVKARFGENAKSKKMRKSMLKQEFSEFRISEAEGLHKGPSHSHLFVPNSASKKMTYADSPSFSSSTYTAPSNLKNGSYRSMASARFNKKIGHVTSVFKEPLCQRMHAKIGNDKQENPHVKIQEIGKERRRFQSLDPLTISKVSQYLQMYAGEFAHMGGHFLVQAYKNSLKTLEKQKRVLQKNQLTLEDKIRVLSIELENTTNLLKHSERINAIAETAKKELQTKLDNHLVQIEKWRTSSKNLFRLIDSSMSVRTKVGLGFNNYIRENELGWDDSAFSVFTTNSEEVEGRPLFNRFAKADSMKAVPPPLSGDYTPLSDHIDLDESQMSYGTKSSTSGDSNSVSNDFVSCDNSDKSSEVNTNDFASSDSSVKSSEPKSNDSTSCASTSSVSTSESEAEIESNVGTPIQEPIIVQDLPSFSCNSSDKNENNSKTFCNKNGYFNKKAGHFRKNALSVSKLCFVCGSSTHLIKDCDFYEKQMANKTVGNGVGPVHSRNNVNHQNQFVPQAVLLRTGKVNIPPARPQPVPTGRQNRPFPVPTDRGYSPSVTSGWWKNGQLLLSPQQAVLGKHIEKENPYSDAEDEGIFDSGCSRSITGRITGKGTIRTPTLDFENVYYVKELQQFNLFSISQICDKKNRVLFTDTDCLVLSKDFMLPDESMVVLRVPRKHNLYTINLNNLSPRGNLACLVAKASVDESVKWHRRMGHVNYKNMNRLVKGNLVRGLPPKLLNNKVTAIRCGKGKEFKNAHIIELCGLKGIKRDYSNARTPQQNGVAKRKNRTLIEAARTMLADSKLPTMFWTEAVRTACYVLNRVLVTSPHNKTPYALLTGNIPSVPFGCHVTILNTSDHLGKFDGKADEGYIVGYSANNCGYLSH
ncbi:putative ribonuclease H-like domain-containing protein [Tanacetum coccineum]